MNGSTGFNVSAWSQAYLICLAQFRSGRNRWGRGSWSTLLGAALTTLWYSAAIAGGVILAWKLPGFSRSQLEAKLPVGLLGAFVFWQLGPLFTMSSGWSLDMTRLLPYPIRTDALFGIELLLRFTAAPELVPVLAGCFLGLLCNPAVPGVWALALFLFLPPNLFFSLSVREILLHGFERNRFRELFTILLVSLAVVPQLLVRAGMRQQVSQIFLLAAHSRWAPWGQAARASLGMPEPLDVPLLLLESIGLYLLARWLFTRSLVSEQSSPRRIAVKATSEVRTAPGRRSRLASLTDWLPDPFATLLSKELATLTRMPRFRVALGMACVFSIVAFIPLAYNTAAAGLERESSFLQDNFLVLVTLYGLLILSDSLILNVFGMDQAASQLYFAVPVPFRTILLAKNCMAALVIALQSSVILLLVPLTRMPVSGERILIALGSQAVVTLFFLAVGNLSSLTVPRPIDPKQTFKKQAGAKIALWLLLCSLGTLVLVGAVLLAQFAFDSAWAAAGVLLFELAVGAIVYRLSLDSAEQRAYEHTEDIVSALSRPVSPFSSAS